MVPPGPRVRRRIQGDQRSIALQPDRVLQVLLSEQVWRLRSGNPLEEHGDRQTVENQRAEVERLVRARGLDPVL